MRKIYSQEVEKTHKYFKQYFLIKLDIQRLELEIKEWDSKKDLYKKYNKYGNFEQAETKIFERLNYLSEKIIEYLKVVKDIETRINTLEDEKLRLILKYYYIDNLTLEQIADKMFYSYMQISTLYKKALFILQDKELVKEE